MSMHHRAVVVVFLSLKRCIRLALYVKYHKRVRKMNFGQVITAMVTPFNEEGNIDFPATKNLLDHLANNGTDAVVVAGTTGESPTLSTEEKIQLFEFVVNEAKGRLTVIAGTGSNTTRESVALTKKPGQCTLYGIMILSPCYD